MQAPEPKTTDETQEEIDEAYRLADEEDEAYWHEEERLEEQDALNSSDK